jgi:TetR/AcrR family transcriptional regulator
MAGAALGIRDARLGPRAERTRAAILEAAERLFAERGFASTRLEDVAEAVGIRRASIVYYFRDKSELYDAVLADVLGALRARLEPVLLGAAPSASGRRVPLAARAEAAVSAWIDHLAARPALARLLLREVADGGPGREPPLARHLRPFFDLVERVVTESDDPLARARGVDPVRLAAQVAGSSVFLVAAIPTLLPGLRADPLAPERLEALRRELIDATRRLLGGVDERHGKESTCSSPT